MRHPGRSRSGRPAVGAVALLTLSLTLATPAAPTYADAGSPVRALSTALAGRTPPAADLAAFHALVDAADIGSPTADQLDRTVHDALAEAGNAARWEEAKSRSVDGLTAEPDALVLRIEYPPVARELVRLWAQVLPDAEAFVRFLTDPRLVGVFSPPFGPSVETIAPPPHPDTYAAYRQGALGAELATLGVPDHVGGGGMFYAYCDGHVKAEAKGRNYGITGTLEFCYDYQRVLSPDAKDEVFLNRRYEPFAEYRVNRWIHDEGGYRAGVDEEGHYDEHWSYGWTWEPEFETCLAKWGCMYKERSAIAVVGYSNGVTGKKEPQNVPVWM